jgi:hypothetical protein
MVMNDNEERKLVVEPPKPAMVPAAVALAIGSERGMLLNIDKPTSLQPEAIAGIYQVLGEAIDDRFKLRRQLEAMKEKLDAAADDLGAVLDCPLTGVVQNVRALVTRLRNIAGEEDE